MSKVCNIAISVLFSLALIGPAAVFVCEQLHVGLPSWSTAEDAKWLSGGSKGGDVKANLSLAGFGSGKLQEAIEAEVGNYVPCKSLAMLGNAALQRGAISLANAPFGWECFPTYFGSERLLIPSQRAVTYLPKKTNAADIEAMREFGAGVAQVAKAYPEKRFVVYVVQGFQSPAVNPAYGLVSDPLLPSDQVDAMKAGVASGNNVIVCSVGYDGVGKYYEDYFRTDHHWNWKGASKAYNEIALELGLPEFVSPGEASIDSYEYMGATARWGLIYLTERVSDTTFDFSALKVIPPGENGYSYGHSRFYNMENAGKIHRFHDAYYDFIPDGSMISGPGEGTALVLSNSYGASIGPYIFMNYKTTAFHEDVRKSGTSGQTLSELVSDCDCDDIFIVASPVDMADVLRGKPDYFDLP